MKEKLEELMEKFGEFEGKVSFPAQHHLFLENDTEKQHDDKKSEILYSLTETILYLMKRVRPEIEKLV